MYAMLCFILTIWISTLVTAIPRPETVAALRPRNEMTTDLALNTDVLTFNIDPDISGPVCGWTYDANINVKHRGDPETTSEACNAVFNYVTAPLNKEHSKDVNLIYLCAGVDDPTQPRGYGPRDINFVLTAPLDFRADQTKVPATLLVFNTHDDTSLSMPVELGYKLSSKGVLKWQYIYCH